MEAKNNRPIKKIKPLIKDGLSQLSKTEFRFLKFMQSVSGKVSDKNIIDFYIENVMESNTRFELKQNQWFEVEYTTSDIKRKSLQWFDLNLGKIIRKNMLSEKGNQIITDLMRLH